MLSIKPGVRLGPSLAVPYALIVCDQVFSENELGCIVTSAREGQHRPGSLHYVDHAFDIRSKHVPDDEMKMSILKSLKSRLGEDFDVVLEDPDGLNEHYHIEYQPKRGW